MSCGMGEYIFRSIKLYRKYIFKEMLIRFLLNMYKSIQIFEKHLFLDLLRNKTNLVSPRLFNI